MFLLKTLGIITLIMGVSGCMGSNMLEKENIAKQEQMLEFLQNKYPEVEFEVVKFYPGKRGINDEFNLSKLSVKSKYGYSSVKEFISEPGAFEDNFQDIVLSYRLCEEFDFSKIDNLYEYGIDFAYNYFSEQGNRQTLSEALNCDLDKLTGKRILSVSLLVASSPKDYNFQELYNIFTHLKTAPGSVGIFTVIFSKSANSLIGYAENPEFNYVSNDDLSTSKDIYGYFEVATDDEIQLENAEALKNKVIQVNE